MKNMNWDRTIGLTLLFSVFVYIILSGIMIVSASAQNMKIPNMPGTPYVAQGMLWPQDALNSMQEARKELNRARANLEVANKLTKAWQANIDALNHKINTLMDMYKSEEKTRKMMDDENSSGLYDLLKEIESLKKYADMLVQHNKDIDDLKVRMNRTMELGASLFVDTSLDYAVKAKVMASPVLGVQAYFIKNSNMLTLSAGAGIDGVSESFAWKAFGTVEHMYGNGFSVGGALSGMWNVGKWEGSDVQRYGAGVVLRYTFNRFSVYGMLLPGVSGKKENAPTLVNVKLGEVVPEVSNATSNPKFGFGLSGQIGFTANIF